MFRTDPFSETSTDALMASAYIGHLAVRQEAA